ncbi:hypothetical protein ACYPKM_05565 [Pseudomonas aeruginosa]
MNKARFYVTYIDSIQSIFGSPDLPLPTAIDQNSSQSKLEAFARRVESDKPEIYADLVSGKDYEERKNLYLVLCMCIYAQEKIVRVASANQDGYCVFSNVLRTMKEHAVDGYLDGYFDSLDELLDELRKKCCASSIDIMPSFYNLHMSERSLDAIESPIDHIRNHSEESLLRHYDAILRRLDDCALEQFKSDCKRLGVATDLSKEDLFRLFKYKSLSEDQIRLTLALRKAMFDEVGFIKKAVSSSWVSSKVGADRLSKLVATGEVKNVFSFGDIIDEIQFAMDSKVGKSCALNLYIRSILNEDGDQAERLYSNARRPMIDWLNERKLISTPELMRMKNTRAKDKVNSMARGMSL